MKAFKMIVNEKGCDVVGGKVCKIGNASNDMMLIVETKSGIIEMDGNHLSEPTFKKDTNSIETYMAAGDEAPSESVIADLARQATTFIGANARMQTIFGYSPFDLDIKTMETMLVNIQELTEITMESATNKFLDDLG